MFSAELVEERHLDVRAERDGSFGRLEFSGEKLEERRLPRAIPAEDPDSLAAEDIS